MEQDHLHIRGEYWNLRVLILAILGLSPHTWRILERPEIAIDLLGIISTYVENTDKMRLTEFEL